MPPWWILAKEALQSLGSATTDEITHWIMNHYPEKIRDSNKADKSMKSVANDVHGEMRRKSSYHFVRDKLSKPPFKFDFDPERKIWTLYDDSISVKHSIQFHSTTERPPDNNGWDAERCVLIFLRKRGWDVSHVAHEKKGYDLFAKKGNREYCIEVKSSVNDCNPKFTKNEYDVIDNKGINLVLAILENFNPMGKNTIYWIGNNNLKELGNDFSEEYVQSYRLRRTWTSKKESFESIFGTPSLFD